MVAQLLEALVLEVRDSIPVCGEEKSRCPNTLSLVSLLVGFHPATRYVQSTSLPIMNVRVSDSIQRYIDTHVRLRAKKGPAPPPPPPPLGNFADISYLEENFKPHLLRDVCTLCSGALVSDSLLHMLL